MSPSQVKSILSIRSKLMSFGLAAITGLSLPLSSMAQSNDVFFSFRETASNMAQLAGRYQLRLDSAPTWACPEQIEIEVDYSGRYGHRMQSFIVSNGQREVWHTVNHINNHDYRTYDSLDAVDKAFERLLVNVVFQSQTKWLYSIYNQVVLRLVVVPSRIRDEAVRGYSLERVYKIFLDALSVETTTTTSTVVTEKCEFKRI